MCDGIWMPLIWGSRASNGMEIGSLLWGPLIICLRLSVLQVGVSYVLLIVVTLSS
jgi:hypothetical protein